MAIIPFDIDLLPEQTLDEQFLNAAVQRRVPQNDTYNGFIIRKKSLDARSKTAIFHYKVEIYTGKDKVPTTTKETFRVGNKALEVHIAGFGPAGMFAALALLKSGFKPIVIERGKKVKDRRRDLAILNKEGIVDLDSNYCFGEGGAGTFSDGKLYTRSNKRGDVQQVLKWLVDHGAKDNILYEAHPHIGTNKLPAIVENIRRTIIDGGGEIHFETRLESINIEDGKIIGLETNMGFMPANKLILATGHSARDVFEMLNEAGVSIENKPFALGVRIEHPQHLIDKIQYKCEIRSEGLPPSSYSLVEQIDNRGVFSFCMCPGGIIAPSATSPSEIVVNGWSPSKRNGQFANSGMVVSVLPDDWKQYSEFGGLAAMKFQAEIEKKAFIAGGSTGMVAPAQRALDFVNHKVTKHLPASSYIPGLNSAEMDDILPEQIAGRLRKALVAFNKKMKGYLHDEALLVAPESRTSSPVRIPRDKENLQHPEVEGLYPCGEGAGYAGGIVSAAIDGIVCATHAMNQSTMEILA